MRSYGRGPDLIGLVSLQEERSPSAGSLGKGPVRPQREGSHLQPRRGPAPEAHPGSPCPRASSLGHSEQTEAARVCPEAGAEWGCCRFLPVLTLHRTETSGALFPFAEETH